MVPISGMGHTVIDPGISKMRLLFATRLG